MAQSVCKVTTDQGGSAIALIVGLENELKPTKADLLVAGNIVKLGILDRTKRGVDYAGNPFEPYSENGPYYYYPAGHANNASRVRAAKRLRKAFGGGHVTRGGGIRFDSYADFKRALGRSGVDLRGPKAPHMLQALVVKVQGGVAYVGIYDSFAAEKASGHNDGLHKRLPRRQFFEASDEDLRAIERDLTDRMITRGKRYMRQPG